MQTLKVLVVDDDASMRMMMKFILEQYKYKDVCNEVFYAASAEEAKKILKTNNTPDILFLDVVMETENAGFEVVHHIRRIMMNQTIKIHILSGRTGNLPDEYFYLTEEIDGSINKSKMDLRWIQGVIKNTVDSKVSHL